MPRLVIPKGVQEGDVTADASCLPVPANVLRVWGGCHREIRAGQGRRAHGVATDAVQPVCRVRGGPPAMAPARVVRGRKMVNI